MSPIFFVLKLVLYVISVIIIAWIIGFFTLKLFYQSAKESLEDLFTEINARVFVVLIKPVVYLVSFVGSLNALDLQGLSGGGFVPRTFRYGFSGYLTDLVDIFSSALNGVFWFIIIFFGLVLILRTINSIKQK